MIHQFVSLRGISALLAVLAVLAGADTAMAETAVIKADNDETAGGMVVIDIQSDGTHLDVGTALSDNNNDTWCLITNYDTQVTLIAWKGMFDAIPQITSRDHIVSATLKVYQRGPVGDETVEVNRVTTPWLYEDAGGNETIVTGVRCAAGGESPYWLGGESVGFSSLDYTTEDAAQFSYTEAIYNKANYVTVTEIVKDMFDNGNQGFVLRQVGGTPDPWMQGDEKTDTGSDGYMVKPTLYITYTADTTDYHLTVNSGSGDGDYTPGTAVSIDADAAPSGMGFDQWAGDVGGVADTGAASTTVTMPAGDVEVTATYSTLYTLTVDSGTGDGSYIAGSVVGIYADAPPSGQTFDQWVGDISGVADVHSNGTTITMPGADATVTATYKVATGNYLTVNSGSGEGAYPEGTVVSIVAYSPPSGMEFNMWGWDWGEVADFEASSTTFTMPDRPAVVTATYRDIGAPADWWPWFNGFSNRNFGAEREPLAYDMHGSALVFMNRTGSEWRHISETSACIAFETNLPARAYVEYGETTSYGSQTDLPDEGRHYYLHVHYLKNLQQNTLYHYRYVAEDERGNIIYSADKTFTTATPANVVYVPAQVAGPPYVLNQSGKTYLLTQDIVCNRTAFEIGANNVTLDLGGHTVIYNEEDYQVSSNYIGTAAYGVKSYNYDPVNVLNGTIKQGAGYNKPANDGIGYNPVFFYHGHGDLAGLTLDYSACQLTGLLLHYATGMTVHHNVVLDRGIDIDNRESGIAGIGAALSVHHNLLKRVRQGGLKATNNGETYANEIYVDSCGTNSFAISHYKTVNAECHQNRIFGTGYLVVGVGTVSSGVADVMVHDNYIHLQAIEPDDRWDEYGAQSGAYCCRITWGGDNIQYYDNTMVTYGRDGGMVRGTWFAADSNVVDCVYDSNICKAVLENMASDIQGGIVHVGSQSASCPPVVYSNNRLISNFCSARMGEDYYGAGQNAEFYDNTFVKVGPSRPDYRTIGVGYGTFRSAGHKFFDSMFEGGASYDEVRFDGSGVRDFRVGWTLTVETEAYADIEIRDLSNSLVYTGQSDGNGLDSTLLYEYMEQSSGRTYETPHSVKVTKGVDTVTESVTVDEKKTVQIWFGASYALTVNSGSGSGNYTEGAVVGISAGSAPSGKDFSVWTGDVAYVADPYSATTTVTMPAMAVEVTATYVDHGYSLTVTNGNGTGVYQPTTVVPISADAPASGKLFSRWIGDTSHLSDAYSASTTVTMPADDISVTATYAWAYSLTVHSGTGSGLYLYSTVVDIQADPAGTNMQFDEWIGDTDHVADVQEGTTTFTMPSHACEVMATYEVILPGDLDGSGMVGQGDLDIILDQWGRSGGEITDPRADANDDDFIGQKDLDIVLDHWGESI